VKELARFQVQGMKLTYIAEFTLKMGQVYGRNSNNSTYIAEFTLKTGQVQGRKVNFS